MSRTSPRTGSPRTGSPRTGSPQERPRTLPERAVLVAVAALAGIGAASCSSSPSIVAVDSPPATAASGSTSSTARPSGTTTASGGNPDFVEQADEICTSVYEAQDALPEPTTDAEVAALIEQQLRILDDQYTRLSALDPPADEELWAQTLDDLKAYNDRVQSLVDDGKTFEEINSDDELATRRDAAKKAARDLGLEVCGTGGKSSGGKSSGGGSSGGDPSSSSTTATTTGTRRSSTTTTEEGRGDDIPPETTGEAAFSAEECVTISVAALDLTLATTSFAAEEAADTLYAFEPPTEVKVAIETLVDGPGLQFDDGGATEEASSTVNGWVDEVCP